jgi:hypothetical protein
MHWISWKKLASPKETGGMGFREFEAFNIALLGKHGWRFMVHPESLCSRVMKSRYFPDSEFMTTTIPKTASPIWRAIVVVREALKLGLIKRVGSGFTISIWEDRWIPGTSAMTPMVKSASTTLQTIDELINMETWT